MKPMNMPFPGRIGTSGAQEGSSQDGETGQSGPGIGSGAGCPGGPGVLGVRNWSNDPGENRAGYWHSGSGDTRLGYLGRSAITASLAGDIVLAPAYRL